MCLCIVRELVPMSPLPLGIEVNLSCKCVKCASLCNEHSDEQVGLGLQGRELGQRWPGFWGWNQVSVFLPSSICCAFQWNLIWFFYIYELNQICSPKSFLFYICSPQISILKQQICSGWLHIERLLLWTFPSYTFMSFLC